MFYFDMKFIWLYKKKNTKLLSLYQYSNTADNGMTLFHTPQVKIKYIPL